MALTAITSTAAGLRAHRVTLQIFSSVPDGQGGYTEAWIDLTPPDWWVSIEAPSARDLAHVEQGSVISSATRILRGRYRPDITTKTQITFEGRMFGVTAVNTLNERDRWLEVVCEEQVA